MRLLVYKLSLTISVDDLRIVRSMNLLESKSSLFLSRIGNLNLLALRMLKLRMGSPIFLRAQSLESCGRLECTSRPKWPGTWKYCLDLRATHLVYLCLQCSLISCQAATTSNMFIGMGNKCCWCCSTFASSLLERNISQLHYQVYMVPYTRGLLRMLD